MVDYFEIIQLGRRLASCKYFRFIDGMLTLCNIRIIEGGKDYVIGHRPGPTEDGGGWIDTLDIEEIYPDLSDWATKGCVLQLIREAWKDPEAHFFLGAAGWVLMSGESRVADITYPSPAGRNEEEAMVNAMEAAP